MARRPVNAFSLSFLDCMCCGFGAVILFFMIINTGSVRNTDERLRQLTAEARMREDLDIYDRVGGGDGFATGMAWAFLDGRDPQEAVEIGAANGALTMTTPGDTSMMSEAEVLKAVTAKGARVVR